MKRCGGITLLELTVAMAVSMIVLGVIFIGMRGNNTAYRDLENASIVLQSDLRYAQRRAMMEGRRVGITFDPARNRYTIRAWTPFEYIRTVYLQNGVELFYSTHPQLYFLPRGTASSGFSLTLNNGVYWQRITATVSGGRIRVWDITREGLSNGIRYEELYGGYHSRQNAGCFEKHAGYLQV
jgi:Tfp pilus assembly protein FimT